MPDKEGYVFDLKRHLEKKKKRTVLSLETYDLAIVKIIFALHQAILTPENDTGVTDIVIFGSWARRNLVTGPTAKSDLDLMAYKPYYLTSTEQDRIEEIVIKEIKKAKLIKLGIKFKEISVWSGLDGDDLNLIRKNQFSMTIDGYIIVPFN